MSSSRFASLLVRASFRVAFGAAGLSLTLVAGGVSAQAQGAASAAAATPRLPTGMTRVTSVEGISEYVLANGLHILTLPDASKPTTTVNLTIRVGSRMENYGETGMAHLLEHLLFKGTPNHPDPKKEMSDRGLAWNGTTSDDRTNYFASMAESPANLDFYLRWLAEALTQSFIAKKDLDSEMTVVRNEMESGENDPGRVLFQNALAASTTGTTTPRARSARAPTSRTSTSRDCRVLPPLLPARQRLPDRRRQVRRGQDARAHRLDLRQDAQADARARADLHARSGPGRRAHRDVAPRRRHADPARAVPRAGRRIARFRRGHARRPDARRPRVPAPQGAGREDLAASAFGSARALAEPGYAYFGAQLKNDQPLEAARDALIATVEDIARTPFTAAELERAKNIWLRGFTQTLNDPQRVGLALSEYIAIGDWRLGFERRDRIKAATLADVNRVAGAYFITSNRTLGSFIPSAAPLRAPAPAKVDVAAVMKDFKGGDAVVAGEDFDVAPANIDRRTTIATLPGAAGIRTALLPKATRGAKVVALIALRLGDEKSLFGRDLAGDAAASMLARGTERLTREELATAFEKLQTSWSVGGGASGVVLRLETTRDNLAPSLALASEVLRTPRFDAREFEQMKTAWVSDIESSRSEPRALLQQRLQRHGNPYPKGDPRYVMTFDEALAEIAALKLDDVRAFYRQFYGASNAAVTAVGDFDPAGFSAQVQKDLGDWTSKTAYVRVPQPVYDVPPADFRIEVKDKQNAIISGRLQVTAARGRARVPGAATRGADLRRLGRRQRPPLGSGAREGRPLVRRRRLALGRAVQPPRRLEHLRDRRAAERRRGSRRVRGRDRAGAQGRLQRRRARARQGRDRRLVAAGAGAGRVAGDGARELRRAIQDAGLLRRARRAAGADHARRSQRRVPQVRRARENGVRRCRRFQQRRGRSRGDEQGRGHRGAGAAMTLAEPPAPAAFAPERLCGSHELIEKGKAVLFDVVHFREPARAFALRFDGRVVAYLNRCVHVPTELDWLPGEFLDGDQEFIICSIHGATYDPRNGRCAGGPCGQGRLTRIAAEERDGLVYWLPTRDTRACRSGDGSGAPVRRLVEFGGHGGPQRAPRHPDWCGAAAMMVHASRIARWRGCV